MFGLTAWDITKGVAYSKFVAPYELHVMRTLYWITTWI